MTKIIGTIFDKDAILGFATPEEKIQIAEAEKIEREYTPAKRQFEIYMRDKKFKLSDTNISGKVRGKFDVRVYPKVAGKIEEARGKYSSLDKGFAKSELKKWGYRISDIKRIYYADNFPALLEMKDGKKIIFAPKIEEQFIDADTIKNEIRKRTLDKMKLKGVI